MSGEYNYKNRTTTLKKETTSAPATLRITSTKIKIKSEEDQIQGLILKKTGTWMAIITITMKRTGTTRTITLIIKKTSRTE